LLEDEETERADKDAIDVGELAVAVQGEVVIGGVIVQAARTREAGPGESARLGFRTDKPHRGDRAWPRRKG